MMRPTVELEALSTTTSHTPEDQESLQDKLQSESIQRNQSIQMDLVHGQPAHRRQLAQIHQNADNNSIASQGIGARVNQHPFKCRSGCRCSFHEQKKSSTPSSFMNRLLGQVFIGYAGLPMISPKCDHAGCEKAQIPVVNVEYWFPLGFCWSKIVQFQLSYRSTTGPQLNLSMLRSVPDTAPCVEFALRGNIEGLKSLFRRGLASPLDVSVTRGYTLVRWALYGKQYQTVRFLVQEGADADYRPLSPYDNSPRNKASDIVLQGSLAREDEEALHCLTQGSDWIEDQDFNKVHKIVCGLSLESLDEALLANPESIDTTDGLGRTPLLWAAARGDAKKVAILLSHGADPNILDHQLAPPVSYAADRGHAVCVRLLLEAGAETDPVLPNGYIGGSALNCAARNAIDTLVLKTLLDFGADIESTGVDGRTPLIHVARTDNASFAILLLEYGADINAISASNQTPLTTAIVNNSHDVLRLLIDRWTEYSECPRLKSPHLLQVAALYGDVETLQILAQTDHFRLKYDKDFSMGDLTERLKGRHDVSEKLIIAFEELLAVTNAEPRNVLNEQDLVEKGFGACSS